ncbi:rifin PIR protein, putative [Plasmodium reichenowi]|uniref:Rifin PIR protein, putative n=1 Tax=Plasmodium reichenowi TaxID=5854 RepID=A0A2P9DCE8_PLARE|nr:rifin PIR protein, putative [Plasmodium reichenowi]
MKLYCCKILLFAIPLNILVTSYQENTHKKPSITPHYKAIYISRLLSEMDIHSSMYDNDTYMKSVKEKFEDRTSQRLREYDERMKEKRQKRKEERDKNIQKIIEKDKREKSLAEKVEKCCLRCGCGLGGVAASVGLFGGLGTYGWKTSAIAKLVAAAENAGASKGAEAGVKTLINKLTVDLGIHDFYSTPLAEFITKDNYFCETLISDKVKDFYQSSCKTLQACDKYALFYSHRSAGETEGTRRVLESTKIFVREAVEKASKETVNATATEMATLKDGELAEVAVTCYNSYSAIGYSVLAILIIVLVMIIIYFVLRYRRKKKMNKKAQYTKLLNQ